MAATIAAHVACTQHTSHPIANGTFTYTLNNSDTNVNALNNGETLSDSIGYTAGDGVNSSSTTLTITINGDTEFAVIEATASITEYATPNTVSGNVLTNATGGV